MKHITKIFVIVLFCTLLISCNKSDYLNKKPDERLIVPETLAHFQAIMDNELHINGNGPEGVVPVLGETASDDNFVRQNVLDVLSPSYTQLYKWDDAFWSDRNIFIEWSLGYRAIFYSNLVLDGLENINFSPGEENDYKNTKGSALFVRAFMFYHLAQVYTPYYDGSNPGAPGLPLRLTSEIGESLVRSTVKETYDRIIEDLNNALPLLPDFPKGNLKTRPSKHAVRALLAKVYLSIEDYDNALRQADLCLQLKSSLMDYNTSVKPGNISFDRYNDEVIFHARMVSATAGGALLGSGRVDTILYRSYATNDLRQTAFFRLSSGLPIFKGSYDGSSDRFAGLATDEIFLIRAECYARKNQITEAMLDLNTLLTKRWRVGTFSPFVALNSNDALQIILKERRKELLQRAVRWTDLRRLNKQNANILVSRIANGQTVTLQPNSLSYTFLIPLSVMDLNPNWQQNPR